MRVAGVWLVVQKRQVVSINSMYLLAFFRSFALLQVHGQHKAAFALGAGYRGAEITGKFVGSNIKFVFYIGYSNLSCLRCYWTLKRTGQANQESHIVQ
jgi:hypothetical protein